MMKNNSSATQESPSDLQSRMRELLDKFEDLRGFL